MSQMAYEPLSFVFLSIKQQNKHVICSNIKFGLNDNYSYLTQYIVISFIEVLFTVIYKIILT